MYVAVHVHAALGNVPKGQVRQQQLRAPGDVQRAADLVEAIEMRGHRAVELVIPEDQDLVRPGAPRNRLSRRPDKPGTVTSPRTTTVSPGSTTRRHAPNSSSPISSGVS